MGREPPLFPGVVVKFMFSKKATKIDKIFIVYLTLYSRRQINGEDFVNFCGLSLENMNFTNRRHKQKTLF